MGVCPTCHQAGLPGSFCTACGARLVPEDTGDRPVDRFLGQTLNGTYFVQQKIGSGGMGDVYKAIHRTLECPVALKIIRPGLLSDPAVTHRFQREARAASRLHHPNVVAVTDFAQTEDGVLFMVMELVSGRTLARAIAEEPPFPEARVVRIGEQILAALAEAHANEILHRDLKAENVMVEARRDAVDAVKVLDFGIARIMAAGSSTLTREGLVCGTPGYMSPEQLRGEEIDVRADLFSVGIVLYEMLTRKLPFEAQTPMEILHRQLSEPVAPPSARHGAQVSPGLERLILRALSPSRDRRPATADAMRDELLRLARSPGPSGAGLESTPATEVLSPDPSRPETPAAHQRRAQEPGPGSTLDAAAVKRIEQRIAPLLGPVTPQLVKRVRGNATTPTDLCRQLADFIPSSEEKKRFLAWSDQHAEPRSPSGERAATRTQAAVPPPRTPAATWDPALLERLRRELAQYLGPVAGAVVRRASPRARDLPELYRRLSMEIPGERDREAFLRGASEGLAEDA